MGGVFHTLDQLPSGSEALFANALFANLSRDVGTTGCWLWFGTVGEVDGRREPCLPSHDGRLLSARGIIAAIDDGGPVGLGWQPTCGRRICVATHHRPSAPDDRTPAPTRA